MILRDYDRGRTVEMAAGDTLTLELNEIPSSGYRWEIESAGRLEHVGSGYAGGGAQVPGAGRVRWFRFRATQPGLSSIKLRNAREGTNDVAEWFEVTISVK